MLKIRDYAKFKKSWYHEAFNRRWAGLYASKSPERCHWKLIVFLWHLGVEPHEHS